MEELRRAARERLQHPESLSDFPPAVSALPDNLHPLWSEISSHNATSHSETCEDLLVAQGYIRAWGPRPLSDDDEGAANGLYDWASRVARPSSIFAEAADLEELSDGKKATIKENILESSLAVSVLASLSALLPLSKAANAVDIVISLASFTFVEDPWTSKESIAKSTEALKSFTAESSDRDPSPWSVMEQILKERVKPLFAKTKNPAITPGGRKNFHPVPLPRFDASTLDPETKPWKFSEVYTTTVFAWIISQYSPENREELEAHFPLLVPPLLALIDDADLSFKARGCGLLTALLKPIRESRSDILKRTNLSSVFEDAVRPCLLSLPSITQEDDSIHLLGLAYPALLSLLQTSYQPSAESKPQKSSQTNDTYINGISSLLRDHLIPSFHHISTTNPASESGFSTFASFPHPRLSTLLLDEIHTMIVELAIHTTKYLQDLIPLLHSTLSNPFGTAHPPLLFAAVSSTRAVILNAHPRLWRWRAEILSGVCSCWIHVLQEEDQVAEGVLKGESVESDASSRKVLRRLKKELKGVVYLLRVALENPPATVESEPGVVEAKEKVSGELEGLVRADGALVGLFVDIDPDDGSYYGES